jgi:xanthine/CO dehydrogenase XdhC/CoxF family maturation factor
MMEKRQIVGLWRRDVARVLVTVVHVEGSSYRRPGARLLLAEGGEYAGTISGGCLEAEVTRKAAWKVRDGAVLERYSTTFDDTSDVPYGLGCGGVVDLLLEPVDTAECEALLQSVERSLAGETSTVVTWLPGEGKALRRVVLDSNGSVVFASAGLSEKKLACAYGLVAGEHYDGRFVERLRAPQRLIVFGAGDDAKPLVGMASLMGWDVLVADGRSQLARAVRFPAAGHVVVAEGADAVARLRVHAEDAVVVMTHSYEQDRSLLTALLPVQPKYLGLLGARHRSSLLVNEAAAASGLSIEVCCSRVWAPVGLNLGGDGPEAIALAVMAEAQAVSMGKMGSSQRLTPQDMARCIAEGGAAQYLENRCALDDLA